jgi:hypothetical protein
MANLLCLLWGHRRTPVVFATNRFYYRRCGLSLDPDPLPEPDPAPNPPTRPTSTLLRPSRPARTAATLAFPRSRPYVGPATRDRERHHPSR